MRRAERRLSHQRPLRRQRPGNRVNRADLQRRRQLQLRHDRRQPLSQHRFAHTWIDAPFAMPEDPTILLARISDARDGDERMRRRRAAKLRVDPGEPGKER